MPQTQCIGFTGDALPAVDANCRRCRSVAAADAACSVAPSTPILAATPARSICLPGPLRTVHPSLKRK